MFIDPESWLRKHGINEIECMVADLTGMPRGKIEPNKTMQSNAYLVKSQGLPRHLPDALQRLDRCKELRNIFSDDFVDLVVAVKQAEHDEYQDVISPWERQHLLLNV